MLEMHHAKQISPALRRRTIYTGSPQRIVGTGRMAYGGVPQPLRSQDAPSALQLHLQELRFRAAYWLSSLLCTFFICTQHSVQLMYLICTPFSAGHPESSANFIFTHLTEGLYTTVNLSLGISLWTCVPLLIYQWWCFLIPSCYLGERRVVNGFLLAMALFFFASVLFAYSWVLPKIAVFLQQFQLENKCMEIKLEARIAPAVEWSFTGALALALLFQIPPLFSFFLYMGLVNAAFLRSNRKYVLFSLLLIASLLSPPDVWSQCVLASAGCALYECLYWCALFRWKWGDKEAPVDTLTKRG